MGRNGEDRVHGWLCPVQTIPPSLAQRRTPAGPHETGKETKAGVLATEGDLLGISDPALAVLMSPQERETHRVH